MYTARLATSQTLQAYLRTRLENDLNLGTFFNPALGGTMVVSLRNQEEMAEKSDRGLSMWQYRITRDDRLNDSPERLPPVLRPWMQRITRCGEFSAEDVAKLRKLLTVMKHLSG